MENSLGDYEGYKSGYVALIGKPNVGKSTLLNNYLGQPIAAVSFRPQTTQRRQLGILTTPEAQIIFVDTPGLHGGDFKLSEFINQEAHFAMLDADLLLFIVDVSQMPDGEDVQLADQVKQLRKDIPKLLVLNKVDLVDPDDLNQHVTAFQNLLVFDDQVKLSATTEEGREALLEHVANLLPSGPQFYPEEQITATNEREIAEDLIRAAAMQNLQEELPYVLFVRVNDYKLREEGKRYIHATVFVERDTQKGILIGKGGSMIKTISTTARNAIESMSGESVFLELQVKVEKNWRNNPAFLQRYGLSHD